MANGDTQTHKRRSRISGDSVSTENSASTAAPSATDSTSDTQSGDRGAAFQPGDRVAIKHAGRHKFGTVKRVLPSDQTAFAVEYLCDCCKGFRLATVANATKLKKRGEGVKA